MCFGSCSYSSSRLSLLCALCWPHPGPVQSRAAKVRTTLPRQLVPRCPDDGPACRLASTASLGGGRAPAPGCPWSEVNSRRGARHPPRHRRVRLSHPAVPVLWQHGRSPACAGRGRQAWACGADPDLSRPCVPPHVQCPTPHPDVPAENLLSCRVAVGRITRWPKGSTLLPPSGSQGFRQATITTWLTRAGEHARTWHERCFCHLHLPHLLLRRASHPTPLRHTGASFCGWRLIPAPALLPVLQLGPRTQHMAHAVIHSLRQMLAPGCLPLFTRDGLHLSFSALTAHFGH